MTRPSGNIIKIKRMMMMRSRSMIMRITNREDVYRADDHEDKREDVYIAEYLSVILVRICTVTKGAPPHSLTLTMMPRTLTINML